MKYRKKPVIVEAVQFLPSKTEKFDIPDGVHLWSDEHGA
jgi:hypothetical protein